MQVTPGGEVTFIGKMIDESSSLRYQVMWYTSMVGKGSSLAALTDMLSAVMVPTVRVIPLVQGRTRRWLLAWSWYPPFRFLHEQCDIVVISRAAKTGASGSTSSLLDASEWHKRGEITSSPAALLHHTTRNDSEVLEDKGATSSCATVKCDSSSSSQTAFVLPASLCASNVAAGHKRSRQDGAAAEGSIRRGCYTFALATRADLGAESPAETATLSTITAATQASLESPAHTSPPVSGVLVPVPPAVMCESWLLPSGLRVQASVEIAPPPPEDAYAVDTMPQALDRVHSASTGLPLLDDSLRIQNLTRSNTCSVALVLEGKHNSMTPYLVYKGTFVSPSGDVGVPIPFEIQAGVADSSSVVVSVVLVAGADIATHEQCGRLGDRLKADCLQESRKWRRSRMPGAAEGTVISKCA